MCFFKKTKIIIGITIILLLFVIDLLCVFNINKPLFAIKESEGVYRGLFYDVYNCHEHSVPQIKSKGTKFSCAILDIYEDKESMYMPTEIDNVSISIFDISLTGATIRIKDSNKNSYAYGEWYKIEKEVNGKWYDLKTIIDDYGFNEIAYLPNKDNIVEFVIDWEWLYGELSYGSYRILKQVNDKYISIEFDIATTTAPLIEVEKLENINTNKYDKYLEKNDINIYISSNIKDVYYIESGNKYSLKDYVNGTWQTFDDSVNKFLELLELTDTLKDGGTKIYKSETFDITIIKCNTINQNKDVFIGDYLLKFDSDAMCK